MKNKKCADCGQVRTLNRSGQCHECEQLQRERLEADQYFSDTRENAKRAGMLIVALLLLPALAQARPCAPLVPATLCQTLQDRPVQFLAGVHGTMASVDFATTVYYKQKYPAFREFDPVARPFVSSKPAAAAFVAVYVLGTAWLAHELRSSHNRVLHKLWWIPQVAGIAVNAYGLAATTSRMRP